jgi:hypothetical protein
MKKIGSDIVVGFLVVALGMLGQTAEAQSCKVKSLKELFAGKPSISVALKKVKEKGESGFLVSVTPKKGYKLPEALRLILGTGLRETPEIPLETHIADQIGALTLKFDPKTKKYQKFVTSQVASIADSETGVGYLEVAHRVVLAGAEVHAPLAAPLKVICKK